MREDEIRQLIRILEENEGIEEIEMAVYPLGGRKIRVSRRGAKAATFVRNPGSELPATAEAPAAAEPMAAPEAASEYHEIKAPMVGTMYRSPSPEAEPFVQEGGRIAPGSVLCIIEAMKLMNEIECDVSGTVREILVENGSAVEFGQTLFLIERD